MTGSYNPWLVALSIGVAVLASYAALSIASRIRLFDAATARYWIGAAAVALGIGIWAMHFIGMLAFTLPVPLAYDIPITLASMLPAVLGAGLVLLMIRRGVQGSAGLIISGTIIGVSIASMHYIGMGALRMQPPIRYDPALVGASVLVAIGAATGALWLVFRLLQRAPERYTGTKLLAAALMGGAIAAMHYLGMAAAHFADDALCLAYPQGVGGPGLAWGVGLASSIILFAAILISVFDARLAEQTTASQARLQQAYAELEERVEARTAELLRSNAELQQFAYVASHDLQEPLRTITSFSQLLERRLGDRLDPESRQFLTFITDGTSRMHALISDLLDYSRLGSKPQRVTTVDLNAVLEQVTRNLEASIQAAGARLTHDPLPTLEADPAQMQQLLQNLIGNAIKFRGSQPPRIHLGVRDEGRAWRLSVQDNGIGIAPEHHENIFTIFQRLHHAEDYEGTGIGLAICRKIVERHQGRIWLESRPGAGTIFYFSLPKRLQEAPR